jgi:hypothetical protein
MDPTRSVRCLLLLAFAVLASPPAARAASSTDYPGPCIGESVAPSLPNTPLYLSSDYHGVNPSTGVILMPAPGRIRLGISCVATGFVVVRIGFESALCTVRGRCDLTDLPGLTQEDIMAVLPIPGEVPFFHVCRRHGFGWYDAVGVAPGTYLAVADSRSGLWGLVDGHGTADTYSFFGNGGAWQPVNCSATPPPPPPPPPDDPPGGCGNQNPDLPQMPCEIY